MEPKKFIPVPLVRQATSYTCGVSALQSVLAYYGFFYREDKLAKTLESSPDHGTKNWEMVKFIKSLGLDAISKTGLTIDDLENEIDNNNLVIVAIQAWNMSGKPINWSETWDQGHYVVTIGYDDNNLYFMDPSTLANYTYLPKSEFLERWHDIDQNEKKVLQLGVIVSNPKNIEINDRSKFLPIG